MWRNPSKVSPVLLKVAARSMGEKVSLPPTLPSTSSKLAYWRKTSSSPPAASSSRSNITENGTAPAGPAASRTAATAIRTTPVMISPPRGFHRPPRSAAASDPAQSNGFIPFPAEPKKRN